MSNLTVKLVLLRAVEFGLKQEIFDESFVDALRDEGAKMTVHFAKKFYNMHYAANLRHSANIVLGICNLEVAVASGGDVQKAVTLIQNEKLINLFRRGFAKVRELSEKTQIFDLDVDRMSLKTCAEQLIVLDDQWNGLETYEKILKQVAQRKEFLEFLAFVTKSKKVFSVSAQNRGDVIFEQKRTVETSIVSMFISDVPIAKLSAKDVIELIAQLETKDDEYLQNRLQLFCDVVPERFEHHAQNFCNDVTSSLMKARSNNKNLLNYILSEYDVTEDSDESVRLLASALAQASIEDIMESIDLKDRQVNIEPYVEVLLQKELDIKDLQRIIRDYGGWQRRVNWSQFSLEDIEWLLETAIEQSPEIVEDIFLFVQENCLNSFWSELPLGVLQHFANTPEMVLAMMPFCNVSAEHVRVLKTCKYLPVLVSDECYEYCYAQRNGTEHLLSLICEVMKEASEEDALEIIVDKINRIREGFAQEPDVKFDDDVFFDKDLHSAVKSVLSDKLYKKVVKKLKEE